MCVRFLMNVLCHESVMLAVCWHLLVLSGQCPCSLRIHVYCAMQPTQRYMVQPVDVAEDVSFQQGRLALLRAAAAECEDLLRNALTMFERVPSAERPVELANRLLEQYATEAEPAEDEGIEQLVHDSINDDMEGTI